MKKEHTRTIVVVFLLLALVLAALAARAIVESRRCLELGDRSFSQGDWNAAVLHYRHALEWYCPVLSSSESACRQLVEIGDSRRIAGDNQGALFAYRSLRAGLFAIRHLWQPFETSLEELHPKIASLVDQSKGDRIHLQEDAYLTTLDNYRERIVSPRRGFFAGIMFSLFLVSLIFITICCFDSNGKTKKAIKIAAPLAALFLFAWLLVIALL